MQSMQAGRFSDRLIKVGIPIVGAFVALFILLPSIAQAQFMEQLFSRTIPVPIKHPPGLPLGVKKVILSSSSSYRCDSTSNLLQGEVTSDFTEGGIEVLDRENLQGILTEKQLIASGIANQTSSAEPGKLVSASTMLSLKVSSCDAKFKKFETYENKKREDGEKEVAYRVTTYHSAASFLLRIFVQVTDLVTGQVISARPLMYEADDFYSSENGYPLYPDVDRLRNQTINSAVWEIHKMFLGWTEVQNLVLYRSKKCNLRQTYDAVKAGLITQALRYAKDSVDICLEGLQVQEKGRKRIKAKAKALAQARYNLGMVHMILGNYETALGDFQKAYALRPGALVERAVATTQKAQQARLAFMAIEDIERMQIEDERVATEEKRSTVLTNEGVIALSKQGLSEVIVAQLITSSKATRLDISPAGLTALSKAGLSDKILQAVIQKAAQQ